MEIEPVFENKENIPPVKFVYDRERDIICLLEKGPGGQFSAFPTKAYKALVAQFGENPTREQASKFIDIYLAEQEVDVLEASTQYSKEFEEVLANFKSKAEKIFGLQIPEGTKAYLTINERCPYDIEENMFYVKISSPYKVLSMSMHELWHFYTWYKFGKKEKELGEISPQKYGDIKEALTVLLNPECLSLLPEGEVEKGYPQHKELRKRIISLWQQNPNIEFVWNSIRKE